jgi:hypothetical protein
MDVGPTLAREMDIALLLVTNLTCLMARVSQCHLATLVRNLTDTVGNRTCVPSPGHGAAPLPSTN